MGECRSMHATRQHARCPRLAGITLGNRRSQRRRPCFECMALFWSKYVLQSTLVQVLCGLGNLMPGSCIEADCVLSRTTLHLAACGLPLQPSWSSLI